jgi:hypothetical protein
LGQSAFPRRRVWHNFTGKRARRTPAARDPLQRFFGNLIRADECVRPTEFGSTRKSFKLSPQTIVIAGCTKFSGDLSNEGLLKPGQHVLSCGKPRVGGVVNNRSRFPRIVSVSLRDGAFTARSPNHRAGIAS